MARTVGEKGREAVGSKLAERGIELRAGADSRRRTECIAVDTATGRTAGMRIRTIRGKGGWQFDANDYMTIIIEPRSSTQRLGDLRAIENPRMPVVYVWLPGDDGGDDGPARFFILPEWMVQAMAYRSHRLVLRRHGWTRPRNPESTHCALWAADMEWFEDDWDLIDEVLGRVAPPSRRDDRT